MDSFAQLFDTLVHNRRSIKPKNYNAIRVDDAIIHQMLENARWAPTHARTEPWHFTVFTEHGLHKFAEFQSALYRSKTNDEQFNAVKYQKLLETPLKASHIILVGMTRQVTGKIPESEEICAVACAVQNMLLTATANNLGCYWSTGGMTYHEEMKAFLGLMPEDKCLGMLYVGNYDSMPPSSTRVAVEEKTKWISK